MTLLERIGSPLLLAIDPEAAHKLSVLALKTGLLGAAEPLSGDRLKVQAAGLDFPNPLGMAAGYDKNAEVPDALLALGFGFVETGTVTPLAQTGNPRPRIFRLTGQGAVVNRLGFNNEGHDAAHRRLLQRAGKPGIVGVNVGANKDSADRIADYEEGVRRFAGLASFLTVNISSPNTPGLRDLQARVSLSELLLRVMTARDAVATPPLVFLKIAPDLDESGLDDIAAEVEANGVDGVIVSNSTLSRAGVSGLRHAREAGGLSGRPLFARSTAMLARMRRRLDAKRVIIAAGGVDSAETALEKIRAGADLVQIYTGMIYGGASLPAKILRGMHDYAEREGLASISDIRGSRRDHWADSPVDQP